MRPRSRIQAGKVTAASNKMPTSTVSRVASPVSTWAMPLSDAFRLVRLLTALRAHAAVRATKGSPDTAVTPIRRTL